MGHALFIFVNDVVTKDILAKEEHRLEIAESTLSACFSLQHILHMTRCATTIAARLIILSH